MTTSSERVLILTSTQKDSESTYKLLGRSNLVPHICANLNELVENAHEGVAALLVAKEVLMGTNLKSLIEYLDAQPSWSDLPVIVLAGTGDLTEGSQQAIQVLKLIRNTTVLERPVRVATLISVVESAVANRRRQYEVRNLLTDLEEARKEADRANKTKSEFLANMSHEIRTPLGVMLGFTEFAVDEETPLEERKEYFRIIQKNGRVLLELVNDILDLAKVEAGRVAIERVKTSIPHILEDVTTAMHPLANSKGVSIGLKVAPNFPEEVFTDPNRLRQIFTNVLGNAVKFTEKGSVNTAVELRMIKKNIVEIVIQVQDTGLGISDAQKEKLFQPFAQADTSTARKFGGTGLGLVLSRKLAEALGGDLRLAHSETGKGSTFEISIQAEIVHDLAPAPIVSEDSKPTHSISGLRILIVDDSADNLFILARILNQVGAIVESVENGEEAVEKALSEDFDVILMDIQMPRMDGNEATIQLRQKGYTQPIIALTANALKGEREKALHSGFDDYLTKPINRKELYASLTRFAENPKSRLKKNR